MRMLGQIFGRGSQNTAPTNAATTPVDHIQEWVDRTRGEVEAAITKDVEARVREQVAQQSKRDLFNFFAPELMNELRAELRANVADQEKEKIKQNLSEISRRNIRMQAMDEVREECYNNFKSDETFIEKIKCETREHLITSNKDKWLKDLREQVYRDLKVELAPKMEAEIRQTILEQDRDRLDAEARDQVIAELRAELEPVVRKEIAEELVRAFAGGIMGKSGGRS